MKKGSMFYIKNQLTQYNFEISEFGLPLLLREIINEPNNGNALHDFSLMTKPIDYSEQ